MDSEILPTNIIEPAFKNALESVIGGVHNTPVEDNGYVDNGYVQNGYVEKES